MVMFVALLYKACTGAVQCFSAETSSYSIDLHCVESQHNLQTFFLCFENITLLGNTFVSFRFPNWDFCFLAFLKIDRSAVRAILFWHD